MEDHLISAKFIELHENMQVEKKKNIYSYFTHFSFLMFSLVFPCSDPNLGFFLLFGLSSSLSEVCNVTGPFVFIWIEIAFVDGLPLLLIENHP